MDDQLLPWLRTQIADAREQADTRHTLACNLVLGSITGNPNDQCDCGWPAAVLAQCEAHTAVLDAYDLVQQDLAHNLAKQRDRHYTNALPRLVKECHHLDGREQGLRYAIGCITTAYQHNPGYQEAWRP